MGTNVELEVSLEVQAFEGGEQCNSRDIVSRYGVIVCMCKTH